MCWRYLGDTSADFCIRLEDVGGRKPAERLEGGQRPESPPSIYVPGKPLISFCKAEKRMEIYFSCTLQ